MVLFNQKWNKILELFFEYPNQSFTIREISKRTKVPTSTIQRFLLKLRKDYLITEENKANQTFYFRFLKSFYLINKILESGLIDYLEKEFNPSAIIIFGSVRKGEYEADSDIDLFVETTKKKEVDLINFEKKIGHKIQLFMKKDINEFPKPLLNSILNGIKLRGYFKIK